ncbi:DUF3349 domain-containing protein [Entomomonas asaccharolytica]|uniref:DUF3349 domain-containing protein n=1 Tax=Entomomonas asaccharolytica TaxID=2785331 RepID=A0A974NF54_9GAMM|nr:DUF3349 domain-containing protein [Entomomonas asaccharolytica]QQP85528.1 DUF3349 domain-containing protein [Entomomonas asaccharolytica]
MNKVLHESLQDAANMLNEAYPNGIQEKDYFVILALLYDYFSDRNLAELISYITNKDPDLVLNDIYASVSTKKPDFSSIRLMQDHLEQYGFSLICTEDF